MNGINAVTSIIADNTLSVRAQKAALEQRATGFRIVLETPDVVYHPGDEVKGVVELELSKPLNTREIRIRLCGSMQCFIRRNYCCSDTMELFAQEMVVWSATRTTTQPLFGQDMAFTSGQTLESRPFTSLSNEAQPSGISQSSPSANGSLDLPTVNVTMVGPDSRSSFTLQTDQEQDTNEDTHCINPCIGIRRPRSHSASSISMPRFDYLSKLKLTPLLRSLGLSPCAAVDTNEPTMPKNMIQRSGSADTARVQANGTNNEDIGLTPVSLSLSAPMPVYQQEHRRLRSFASMEEPNQLSKGFHRFPFQFVLPTPNGVLPDIPSTFYESLTFIRYELTASYAQPWPKPRRNISIDLPVQSRVPVNRRRLEQPAEGQNSMEVVMGGFWTRMGRAPKGIVSCKVLLDRTGFLLGEDIPVNVEVKHFCELQQAEGVLVELRRRQTVNIGSNSERISRTISYAIAPVTIDAETLSTNMTIILSTDVMEPPTTIRRDSNIHLSYYVMVSVFPRRGCHDTRLTVRVPIVMANYRRPTPSPVQHGCDVNGQVYRHRPRISLGEPLPLYTRVAEQGITIVEGIHNDILTPPPSYDLVAVPPSSLPSLSTTLTAETTHQPVASSSPVLAPLGSSLSNHTTSLMGLNDNRSNDPNHQENILDAGDDILEEIQIDSDDANQALNEDDESDTDSQGSSTQEVNVNTTNLENDSNGATMNPTLSMVASMKLDDANDAATTLEHTPSSNMK